MGDEVELDALQQVWDEWARFDPLWAILSDPTKSDRRWDVESFLATGRQEIEEVMRELDARRFEVPRGRSLDFGCGVGRLTQALADYFDVSEGVDISPTMVQRARELNRHATHCRFHVNDHPDLRIFPDASFDFIYSNIALQHIPPDPAEAYVHEFVRLLADGGVAVFQVPSRRPPAQEAPPLPRDARRAGIADPGPLAALRPGERRRLRLSVRNESGRPWPRTASLRLGNHWRRRDGQVVEFDDGRSVVEQDVLPGEEVRLDLTVQAPGHPGAYVLELDMVQEGVCWFADDGSPTRRLPVRVGRTWERRLPAPAPARRGGAAASPDPGPKLFETYALATEQVVAAVTQAGGRILDIQEFNPVGEGWESYRYYVSTGERSA